MDYLEYFKTKNEQYFWLPNVKKIMAESKIPDQFNVTSMEAGGARAECMMHPDDG